MIDVDYIRPCKTHEIRDDFKAHVARGSVLPGIDFGCNTGDKVWATADGHVILADGNANQVRGRNVIINHKDGKQSHYLHLSVVDVRNGQHVKAGEVIGKSGNTGTTSTGAHLHFAIKKHGECLDPEALLRRETKERRVEKRKKAAAVASVPVEPAPVAEAPGTATE